MTANTTGAAPYPDPGEAWQGAADLLGVFLNRSPRADLGTILLYAHMAEHGVLPALAATTTGAWVVMIVERTRFLVALRGTKPELAAEVEAASKPGEVSVFLFGANYHAAGCMQWTPLSAGGNA